VAAKGYRYELLALDGQVGIATHLDAADYQAGHKIINVGHAGATVAHTDKFTEKSNEPYINIKHQQYLACSISREKHF